MALVTRTAGTNATTSLNLFIVGVDDSFPTLLNPLGGGGSAEAYVAFMNTAIKKDPIAKGVYGLSATSPYTTDVGTVRQAVNQAYSRSGYVIIPDRGILKLKTGDAIAWDATTGWPIILSADALNNGPWTKVNT